MTKGKWEQLSLFTDEELNITPETLIPGANAREFGTAVQITDFSFNGLQNHLKTLRDDYEHHRKNFFPFYQEEPRVIVLVPPLATVNIEGEPTFSNSDIKTSFCWYLCVPKEHLVEQAKNEQSS